MSKLVDDVAYSSYLHLPIDDLISIRSSSKNDKVMVDSIIDKLHLQKFGATIKSIKLKIKDLKLDDIAQKLSVNLKNTKYASLGKLHKYGLVLLNDRQIMNDDTLHREGLTNRFPLCRVNAYFNDDAHVTTVLINVLIRQKNALKQIFPALVDEVNNSYYHFIHLWMKKDPTLLDQFLASDATFDIELYNKNKKLKIKQLVNAFLNDISAVTRSYELYPGYEPVHNIGYFKSPLVMKYLSLTHPYFYTNEYQAEYLDRGHFLNDCKELYEDKRITPSEKNLVKEYMLYKRKSLQDLIVD